ncbi:hypothetical protein [Fodinibius halophilus]|uniref:6-bladed beta-propeller n=1 Tax=Fodinibius halophilus TaxID=1736908 RepID=A0A6M1T9W5_9BACT|nr:hypothetical protein [Fodinibius halophilus]NGP87734.1 hypothetical protein [Fodinibius halophilus]
MSDIFKLFFCIFFLFLSCKKEKKKFTNKSSQNIESRIVKGTLAAVDSLNLSKFQLYDVRNIRQNTSQLFISGEKKIVAITKDNFSDYKTFHIAKGKGPQEILQLQSFDVVDSLLVVLDERQNKVLTYKPPGEFIEEHTFKKLMPHQIRIVNSNSYVLFSPMVGMKYIFNLVNVNNGTVHHFENVPSEHNPMLYEGIIEIQNSNLYYAGYSEPLLKKYSSEGELVYSVAIIDNFNTEANYLKSKGETMLGYAPGAQFSTVDFDISGKHILAISYGFDNEPNNIVDVYEELTGKYIRSLKGLKPKTIALSSDENHIYGISITQGKYILTLYKNSILM